MSFTRTKVLAAALFATLAVSTPSFAGNYGGYSDNPMMGGDNDEYGYGSNEDYGPGSGRPWQMMREWMREHENSPEFRRMIRRHLMREWMRNHGYGGGMGWRGGMGWNEGKGWGGRGMMGGGYGQHGWMMRDFGNRMGEGFRDLGSRFGGMGPGMMYGYGFGSERRDLNLTTDRVKNYLDRMIRNPNLTVGNVKEKDDNTITAEIVTKQGNSLVQTLDINKHTGFVKPEGQSRTTGSGQSEEPQGQQKENNDDTEQNQQ
jgi:hypothetical protein